MLIPPNTPGQWNTEILIGATWGPNTITMTRDGVTVIPVSASFRVFSPDDGSALLTIAATIDGGGVMTVGPLSATDTAAITWTYGNLLFTTTEGDGTVTDLLAGNATVRNYSE